MTVLVRGDGVAATACAHLLGMAGIDVTREALGRGPAPFVMLGGQAIMLLRDVFGQADLFDGLPPVRRRIVSWGGQEAVAVPHDGVVVSDEAIRRMLDRGAVSDKRDDVSFAIHAADPLPSGEKWVFGDREASAVEVSLRGAAAHEECRTEALEAGWLFLLPTGAGRGWLLSFGADHDKLLAESRLVAPVIDGCDGAPASFATAPRMAMPLAGDDWLACGSTALGFDPICGDGTAQAAREAILAAAVICSISRGGDARALLTHYRSMLIAAMRRHLQHCIQFYATGGQGEWWQAQTAELQRGYEACTRLLATMPEPQFVLRGFSLVPRAEAA